MNKLKFFSIFLLTAAMVYVWGCGDDTTTGGNNTGGTAPTINMKVGNLYTFNLDSLDTNGSIRKTKVVTKHTYLAQGTYFGESNAFQIESITKDSTQSFNISTDTFYVRYDGGKFYQYGVLQLISPTIPASWDLVADFNVAQGSQYTIKDNVPITLGTLTVTANIKGKIAADTTFHTTAWGNIAVNCFRVEITADLLLSGFPLGTVYVDYYIGDADPTSNPSGLVKTKLRPVKLPNTGTPIYSSPGVDQYLRQAVIVP